MNNSSGEGWPRDVKRQIDENDEQLNRWPFGPALGSRRLASQGVARGLGERLGLRPDGAAEVAEMPETWTNSGAAGDPR